MIHIDDLRLDFDFRIDFANVFGAGDNFWQTISSVAFREHRLALQIREFDKVAIGDSQTADARARQRFRLRRTQRATTNDQGARSKQTILAFFANPVEKNLAAVTIVLRFQIWIILTLAQSSTFRLPLAVKCTPRERAFGSSPPARGTCLWRQLKL